MTDNIDSETGLSHNTRSPRFTQWVAFLGFSVISLGAAVEAKNSDNPTASRANQRWAVACCSITCALTFIMVALQLHPIPASIIVGTKIEGVVVLILAGFWAATVAVVSDARNGLAVDEEGKVESGNLYYFSWAGFICSVILTVSYLRAAFGVDVASELRNRSARLTLWAGLLAGQLVIMGSCANIFDQRCAPMTDAGDEGFCKRTKFGISVGVVGTAFSLGVVGMKVATSQAPFILEAIFACMLLAMNGVGIALITSGNGPGGAIGNLYYFTWISGVCAFFLTFSCLQDFQRMSSGAQAADGAHTGGTPTENDIPVEPLDKNADDV